MALIGGLIASGVGSAVAGGVGDVLDFFEKRNEQRAQERVANEQAGVQRQQIRANSDDLKLTLGERRMEEASRDAISMGRLKLEGFLARQQNSRENQVLSGIQNGTLDNNLRSAGTVVGGLSAQMPLMDGDSVTSTISASQQNRLLVKQSEVRKNLAASTLAGTRANNITYQLPYEMTADAHSASFLNGKSVVLNHHGVNFTQGEVDLQNMIQTQTARDLLAGNTDDAKNLQSAYAVSAFNTGAGAIDASSTSYWLEHRLSNPGNLNVHKNTNN